MARRTESYCTCSLAGLATFLHYHSTSLNHAHYLHCRLFHALNLCLSSHVIQTCADTFMIILSFTVLLSLRIPHCYCYSLLSSVSSSVATSSITTFYHYYYYKFPFSMPLIPEVLSERSWCCKEAIQCTLRGLCNVYISNIFFPCSLFLFPPFPSFFFCIKLTTSYFSHNNIYTLPHASHFSLCFMHGYRYSVDPRKKGELLLAPRNTDNMIEGLSMGVGPSVQRFL